MNAIDPIDPHLGRRPIRPQLHHVGLVVSSIQDSVDDLAESMGADWDGKIIYDPLQVVRVAFLRCSGAAGPLVELVEPGGDHSPVLSFLQRGGGVHHLCYEVEGLESQIQLTRSRGGIIVKPPLPAVAFEGRRIAWVYTKHKVLLEFLERQLSSHPVVVEWNASGL